MSTPRLTPERLFSSPPLFAGAPTDLRFTPDGKALTYLAPGEDDRERMDLWRIDIDSAERVLWLDARDLSESPHDVTRLTAEERAERERRRQFSHGITAYSWHRDGKRLLVPMDGRAALIDMSADDPRQSRQMLAPPDSRQSGFQLSPDGSFVSYVREGELYVWDIRTGQEHRLTMDASPTICNGLPDFLAAEEMHRFSGHWWSKNSRYVVCTRVDEGTVAVSHRLEMEADGAHTVPQRYPFAGEANPDVSLWAYDLQTRNGRCIWRNDGDEAYLARVHTERDHILIQIQDRLQQQLTLRHIALSDSSQRDVYAESSTTWINLTDDLRVLKDGRVLMTSELSGTRVPMLIDARGDIRVLPGPTHVNAVKGLTDDALYVSGWDQDPQQNHLFRIPLGSSGAPEQVTTEQGWHEVVLNHDCSAFIDRFSAPQTVLKLTHRSLQDPQHLRILHEEDIGPEHAYAPYLPQHADSVFGRIKADDGQWLYYRLTPPAQIKGKHPTIVYVYGGPGPQKARRDWGTLLVQMFAQHGFGVLELDNRGSGNRGHAFEAPIYRRMGHVEVKDQVAGLGVLDQHGWADADRVGVFGHSYGGYMTLMCLGQAPDAFHAGVAVAPVCDWHLYDTHYTERYMGLPQHNKDGYNDANVLTHLHQLQAPLLLMHGMADDNVLFTNSTKIMSHLQHLGKPFELMTYPGAKHSMQERDVSIHRFNMILDFFSRHLTQRQPKP